MSDMRGLVAHDLPEYEPNDPPRKPRRRVKVYKSRYGWRYQHRCGAYQDRFYGGWLGLSWPEILQAANEHAKECR